MEKPSISYEGRKTMPFRAGTMAGSRAPVISGSSTRPEQRRRFNALEKHGLKTARASGITDLFRWFWRHVYSKSVDRFFKRWYAWAVR
jgi:hypothetical protein